MPIEVMFQRTETGVRVLDGRMRIATALEAAGEVEVSSPGFGLVTLINDVNNKISAVLADGTRLAVENEAEMRENKLPLHQTGSLDHFDVVARLAELLHQWDAMPSEQRRSEAGRVALAEVRGIGETAAYFGGFDAMQALDRETSRTGAPHHHLNAMWDLIGGWVA
jgi:hypothetical protein